MIEITDFIHNGKTFTLKNPLKLFIEEGVAYNDDVGISVIIYSKMENQLITFAKKQLSDLWGIYAECRDEELSDDGLKIKEKLLELVE